MSQSIDLGYVTAYAAAVESGYTGTYAEFCAATANVAEMGELQVDTMPTASADRVGQVVQYKGTTTQNYTHGYFYECVEDNNTYSWEVLPTAATSGGHTILNGSGTAMTQRDNLQFIGATVTDDSTNGRTVVDASLTTLPINPSASAISGYPAGTIWLVTANE